MDGKITQEELTTLKNCKTSEEWDNACDKIIKSRNGKYPSDWFPVVILSGLMEQVMGEGSSGIELFLI